MFQGKACRGFIAEREGFIYFTDGTNVYAAASKDSVEDVLTGYLIAQWECPLDKFQFVSEVLGVTEEEIRSGLSFGAREE